MITKFPINVVQNNLIINTINITINQSLTSILENRECKMTFLGIISRRTSGC